MMFKKPSTKPVEVDPNDMNPQTASEFAARGWLFFGREEYEKAIADYREALKQEENDPDTLYALGLALSMSSQPQESIQVFDQALQSLETVDDKVRVRMLTRLIKGHISRVKTGDWHLTH